MSKGNTSLVFVYGTLKKNEPNYHWLTNQENGEATFVCTGRTSVKFPLVISSRYNIPFLLDKSDCGKNVEGEVYEVDDKMLTSLDILEESPNLYIRRIEEVMRADGGSMKAWIYFLPSFRPELLELPFLESYSSTGPHNLPYLSRYLRNKEYDHRPEVRLPKAQT